MKQTDTTLGIFKNCSRIQDILVIGQRMHFPVWSGRIEQQNCDKVIDKNRESGLVVLVDRLCVLLRRHHRHGVPRLWQILAALQQNGYRKEFIQRTIKKYNSRKDQPRERPEEPKQTKSTNLPYIQGLSELKRALNKQHSTPRQPLEVCYQNQRKSGTILMYINQTVKIVKLSM